MGNTNTFQLIGNVGNELKLETKGGKSYTRIRLAENYSVKEDGEWQQRTNWFDIVVFDKRAESLVSNLSKGRQVCITGRLQTRQQEVAGGIRTTISLIGEEVTFLGKA